MASFNLYILKEERTKEQKKEIWTENEQMNKRGRKKSKREGRKGRREKSGITLSKKKFKK